MSIEMKKLLDTVKTQTDYKIKVWHYVDCTDLCIEGCLSEYSVEVYLSVKQVQQLTTTLQYWLDEHSETK